MKRPAASRKVCKKPVSTGLVAVKKRAYSQAYHTKLKELMKAGFSKPEVLQPNY